MMRFILRRLAQMIPTAFGVVCVTFILFHLVGGSPATMALGEHASPKALDDFDEVRGLNKPIFIGRWSETRAWEENEKNAAVIVTEGTAVVAPLRCPLRASGRYRVQAAVRAEGRVTLEVPGVIQGLDGIRVGSSKGWTALRWEFGIPRDASVSATQLVFRTTTVSTLQPGSLRLRRANAHGFDSQFFNYIRQLATGDMGWSDMERRPVAEVLRDGIGPSLRLTIPILIGGALASLAVSLVCAFFRNSRLDRALVVISVALMSVNYLVWIVAGQYGLGFRLGWFPVWGYESAAYLVLPVMIGIVSGLGADVRLYRSVLLEETGKEYVRSARAKGAGAVRVMTRHMLRNALIPVVTNISLSLPFLFTGSLLLENFFGIPGLGYLGVNAIYNADMNVLRAVVWVGAGLYMTANLLCDLLYAVLDPRVRLS